MRIQPPTDLTCLEIDPEEQGARYWYERYCEQRAEIEQLRQRVQELEEQFESLNEQLRKLSERISKTSSQPPSSDGPKKPNNRDKKKPQRKRGHRGWEQVLVGSTSQAMLETSPIPVILVEEEEFGKREIPLFEGQKS